ncbi:MAG: hypothetical protein E7385_06690 [Ruminococcaceae bacterium]|nr:hypothetical protein [Oscillospiraceae bacterium]
MKKSTGIISLLLLICIMCSCGNNTLPSESPLPTNCISDIETTPFPEYVYNGSVVLLDSVEDYPQVKFDSNSLKTGIKFNSEFEVSDYSKIALYVKIKSLRKNQAVVFYVNGEKVFTLTRDTKGATHDITKAILPALTKGENTLSATVPSGANFEGILTLYSNGYLLQNNLDIKGSLDKAISEGLYGMNMEITRKAWHYGLSAQMINNRKFYAQEDGKPAGWNGNNFEYITDVTKSMCQSNYVALEKGGEISHQDQWIYLAKNQSYEIKVWTNSDLSKQTELEIYLNDKKITTFTVKPSNDAYNEYSFIYKADETIQNGTFTIKNKTASVDIYQVSMMNTNNYMGMRPDVIEALKELKPSTLRYPGGCCVDKWDWKESLKEPHLRKPMNANGMEGFLFTATYNQDTFDFGLKEFMALCELTGAKAELTVSLVAMDAKSSSDLVKYCKENGYEVLNWYIGNEVYFFGGEYAANGVLAAKKTSEFIREMRKVDENINVVIGINTVGNDLTSWSEQYVKNITEQYEYISVHEYYGPATVTDGHFNGLAALNELGAFKQGYSGTVKNAADLMERMKAYIPENATLYVDEWNWGFGMMPSTLMYMGDSLYWHTLANGSLLYPAYSASFFHPLEGMIFVTPNEAKITAVGTAFQLFVKHKNQTILESCCENKALSILATQGTDNGIISVVNREQAAVRLTVNSEINSEKYSKVKIYTIEAKELDLENTALVDEDTVKIYQLEKDITENIFTIDIPGASLVVVELLK